MKKGSRGPRGKQLSLNAAELASVRNLVYNLLSQTAWPAGLDVPNSPDRERENLKAALEKMDS